MQITCGWVEFEITTEKKIAILTYFDQLLRNLIDAWAPAIYTA